jgi:hypothetical protein
LPLHAVKQSTNEIVGKRRGPRFRSKSLHPFQLPCWIRMKKTNTTVPLSNGVVSAEMDIFIFTPELLEI